MPKITKHGGPTNALANPPEPTPVVVVEPKPEPTPVVPETEPEPEPEPGGEDTPSRGTNSSESSEKGEKKPPETVKKNPSPARSAASHSPRRRTGAAGSAGSTDGRKAE